MSRNVKARCNIDNQVFGYLTVIGYAGQGKQFCKCECGSEVKIPTGSLKGGLRTSCGCRKYFREQSKECIKCGVILCDKNEYKSRTYSSGKKAKSSICKHCRAKSSFCYYNYEDPKIEKLSLKRNKDIANQISWYKNGEAYRERDVLYKKKLTADLHDKYITKVLLGDGYSKQEITPKLIESRRAQLKAYREKTGYFCQEDYIKYEYKGVMYNQKNYCEMLAKESGLSFDTVKSRVKKKWSLEDILSTPMYKLPEKTRKEYGEKMGAQVKIYDLDDNLLFECNTYNEAAKLLGTSQSNIVNTCMRFGVFDNKYKIRSKSSSLEKKELLNKQVKANNDNWCRIEYPTPELNALASKRGQEITYKIYYANNKEIICERIREYLNRTFDARKFKNKEYYATNKEYIRAKHSEWLKNNKQWAVSYRKQASKNLTDDYVKRTLMTTIGLKTIDITPEMIEIKRKQISLYRELKELK
jgi:hypothetical protein